MVNQPAIGGDPKNERFFPTRHCWTLKLEARFRTTGWWFGTFSIFPFSWNFIIPTDYPLVNVQMTVENHHFWWVNHLSMAIFNSTLLVYQRVENHGFHRFPMDSHYFVSNHHFFHSYPHPTARPTNRRIDGQASGHVAVARAILGHFALDLLDEILKDWVAWGRTWGSVLHLL